MVRYNTDIMKTQGLKQALNKYGFDALVVRVVMKKISSERRVHSFRDGNHTWDPKNRRPLTLLFLAVQVNKNSIRVFPLSNWTELDIWQYIYLEGIDIVSTLPFRQTSAMVDVMACWSRLMMTVWNCKKVKWLKRKSVIRFRKLCLLPLNLEPLNLGRIHVNRHYWRDAGGNVLVSDKGRALWPWSVGLPWERKSAKVISRI